MHVFHDNLYEYWYENGHGNVMESAGDPPRNLAMYNNVYRHINPLNQAGDPMIWPDPAVGYTFYYFNNVSYDVTNMEYFNVGQNNGDQGTIVAFNNTFQNNSGGGIYGWVCPQVYAHPIHGINNHYIINGSSAYTTGCASANSSSTTELVMSHVKANAKGYIGNQTYAYSPSVSGNSTVGAGTNEASGTCAALSTAANSDPVLSDAVTACQSDTRYACTYYVAAHSVSCPARTVVARPNSAWNIGAYQAGTQASTPNPPRGFTASVQ